MRSTMPRVANQDGAVTRNVPRGTPLTDPTASSASSSSSRMTLHRSRYSLPDSVRLRRRLLRLSRRDPKCFSRNIRCLLVIAVESFNRSAAPTKLPDSTTCRNTFMLSRVSIPDMVYLAAEKQPEGSNPFRLAKEQSRSGWEIAIVQGGQRFGTQHCRPWAHSIRRPRVQQSTFHLCSVS